MRGFAMGRRSERLIAGSDGIKWTPSVKVIKYNPDTVAEITRYLGFEPEGTHLRFLEATEGLVPDEITEGRGNLLTTAGLNRLTNLIIGGGGAAFNSTQAVIGVGSVNTAATVADTALGGNGNSTTAWYQLCDATYPTQSNGVITANATFASANGNFTWNEWCFAVSTGTITAGNALASVGATTNQILNHRVQSLGGPKVSGAVWTLQATVTIA